MTIKNTYTGIIHSVKKMNYHGKIKIIMISDVKLFGYNDNIHIVAWVRYIDGFNHLKNGDVIKFTAGISNDKHIIYHTKRNKKDVNKLINIPLFINIINLIHLKDETDNKRIKIRSCKKCGTIIYYKERGGICDKCRKYRDKIKHMKYTRAERAKCKAMDEKNKTKKCQVCGKTYLKITHYVDDGRSKDGYSSKCIYC